MKHPAVQPSFVLPVVRRVEILDRPGVVTLRMVDQHTGLECFRMEFTPEEADRTAAYMTSAATQAILAMRPQNATEPT